MDLDKFIEEFFENLMSKEGIEQIKEVVKKDMKECEKDYKTTQVLCQVFTESNNYEPRVEINSENYNDGEVVFIDFHVDKVE